MKSVQSTESKPLVNRVAQSNLINFNLEEYYPDSDKIARFDVADYLFKGLVLREREYRAALKAHDWSVYQDKVLLVYCSTDAIVPTWAFMLATVYATGIAEEVFYGTESQYIASHYRKVIAELEKDIFTDKPVVIKGCSNKPVPPEAYVAITQALKPYAKMIMYGEPCSTVPLYKKPRPKKQ